MLTFDSKSPYRSQLRLPAKLSGDYQHTLHFAVIVFVRSGFAIVKVDLDRKPLVRWQGKTSRCTLPEYWRDSTSAGSLALGGWKGPTTFASVKLRSLGGRMKLWRPEPKPRER